MIVYPAIDLKDGRCVRLVRGQMGSARVFNDDPADQARRFAAAGCEWLHVVDLNGAFAGHAVNAAAVAAIRQGVDLKIQLGGGIRRLSQIEHWLALGIDRVILGTAALHDPDLVREAVDLFPGRIALAIDTEAGRVKVAGWAESADIGADELALRFAGCNIAAIIHTDIARDGALAGVDAEAQAAFARVVRLPVIASGGVASLADIIALKAREDDGIAGVVCGRALYDGRLDPRAALRVAAGDRVC